MADDFDVYTLDQEDPNIVSSSFEDDVNDSLSSLLVGYDDLIRLGQGNQVINIDQNQGLWIGNANFSSAPFSVDMDGNVTASTLVVSQIDIPDADSTTDSFHVATDGDTWWGATTTSFNADNDNAKAFVLKDGTAKFQATTTIGDESLDQFVKWNDVGNTVVVNNSGIAFQNAFGDGDDGNLTTSGNVTLTSDVYYDSLTVSTGDTITTAGYRIFVKDTLTVDGTIEHNGNTGTDGTDASGGTFGAGGAGGAALSAGFFNAAEDGKTGGTGGTPDNAGTAGTNGDGTTTSLGVAGSDAGDGGTGGTAGNSRAGGTGGAATAPSNNIRSLSELIVFRDYSPTSPTKINGSAGSGSGGGGGGGTVIGAPSSQTGAGGGGAGSGSPGGTMIIAAAKIVVSASGTISCTGGTGGAGGDGGNAQTGVGNRNGGGGGGGGAGGSGGIMMLVYKSLANSGTIGVTGGTGGTGGASGASGDSGTAGDAGTSGTSGVAGLKIEIPI